MFKIEVDNNNNNLSENTIIQNDDATEVLVEQVEDTNKQNQSLLISQSYYECIKEKDNLHEGEILEYVEFVSYILTYPSTKLNILKQYSFQ